MRFARWITAVLAATALFGLLSVPGAGADTGSGPVRLGSTATFDHDGALVPVTISFCLAPGDVEHVTVSLNQATPQGTTSGGTGYYSSSTPPCVDNTQSLLIAVPGSFRRGTASAHADLQVCHEDASQGIPCGSPPPASGDITLVKDHSHHANGGDRDTDD